MSLMPDARYEYIEKNIRTPDPVATREYNNRMAEFHAAANNSADPANMTREQIEREREILSSGPIDNKAMERLERLDNHVYGNTSNNNSSSGSQPSTGSSTGGDFNTSTGNGSTNSGSTPGVGPGGEFNSSTGDFDKKMENFEKANEGVDSGWSNPKHNTDNNDLNNSDPWYSGGGNNSGSGTAAGNTTSKDQAPASPNTDTNDGSGTTDSKYQNRANGRGIKTSNSPAGANSGSSSKSGKNSTQFGELTKAISGTAATILNAPDAAISAVNEAINLGADILGTATSKLSNTANSLLGNLFNTIDNIAGGVLSGVNGIVNSVSGILQNTSNMIDKGISLFNKVACGNSLDLNLKRMGFNLSLNRKLDFSINTNLCTRGLSGNPINAILKGIKTGFNLNSIVKNLKKTFIDQIVGKFVGDFMSTLGLPQSFINCILDKAGLDVHSQVFNTAPLRVRFNFLDRLLKKLCGSTPSSKISMLQSNRMINLAIGSSFSINAGNYGLQQATNMYVKAFEKNAITRDVASGGIVRSLYRDTSNITVRLAILGIIKRDTTEDPNSIIYTHIDAETIYRKLQQDVETLEKLTRKEYKELIDLLRRLDKKWDKHIAYHLRHDKRYCDTRTKTHNKPHKDIKRIVESVVSDYIDKKYDIAIKEEIKTKPKYTTEIVDGTIITNKVIENITNSNGSPTTKNEHKPNNRNVHILGGNIASTEQEKKDVAILNSINPVNGIDAINYYRGVTPMGLTDLEVVRTTSIPTKDITNVVANNTISNDDLITIVTAI